MKALTVIIIIIALTVLYSVIENRYLKTVCYVLEKCMSGQMHQVNCNPVAPTDEAEHCGLSIVHLSDLHNCRYGKDNHRLLERILRCKPDLIFMTGDMINKYKAVPQETLRFLKELSGVAPCICSMGNHELKERAKFLNRFSEYSKFLQECGIILSDNEMQRMTINGVLCNIASYSSDLESYKRGKRKTVNTISVEEPDDNSLAILLSHDPELADAYKNTGYSVVFCGHLHGGIVRIPAWRGLVSPRFVLFPKYDGGCYTLDGRHVMIVSRGLGSHTIKFRLFNRPEIVHAKVFIERNCR